MHRWRFWLALGVATGASLAAAVLAFILHRERTFNAAERERLERLLSHAEEREQDVRERLEEVEAERDRIWRIIEVEHFDGERIRRIWFDRPGLRNDTGKPNSRWRTPSPLDPSKVKPGDRDSPPPEVEQHWPPR